MTLTDDELSEIFDALYNKAYYGDDYIVYTSAGDTLRSALGKVEDEIKRRERAR